MQNPQLVTLAKKYNIQVTDVMTDDQIQSAIDAKFTEVNTALADAGKKLSDEKKAKAVELVDAAIASGKIGAEDGENFAERKEALVKFAESDYAAAKTMLDGMTDNPESALLKKTNLATNKVDLKNKTAGNPEMSKVTFDDVIGNPEKYMGKFTDEELKKLHQEDSRWKSAGIASEK